MRHLACAFLLLLASSILPGSAAFGANVPPPAPESQPSVAPGVVPVQAAEGAALPPPARTRALRRAAAAGETLWIWQDSLESRWSPDNEGGFTHYDASEKPPAWHIDSIMACEGNAMWCGRVNNPGTCNSVTVAVPDSIWTR